MHSRPVPDERRRTVRGLPATDPVRTVLDCARLLDRDWGVAVADAALHLELCTLADLAEATRELPRQPGVARARSLPVQVSLLSESPGESLLRMRLGRMGLSPAEQVIIGSARVDFLIDDALVIEFDGRAKYERDGTPAEAHWAEKRRNDMLVERGYEVIHVTWDELWDERALELRIRAALDRTHRRAIWR